MPIESLERDGYAQVSDVVGDALIRDLVAALEDVEADSSRQRRGKMFAARHLLEAVPLIAQLAQSAALRRLVEPVLGAECFAVRGLLFDKIPEANWKVHWHQDLTIAVQTRREVPGFGPWSVKDNVVHVQPPVEILTRMLTLRLHLDDCSATNGPLQVLPGTHRRGRLSADEIALCRSEQPALTLCVPRGNVIAMRPLLLHASSAASAPGHRRVLHIEYAAQDLPGGLEWYSNRLLSTNQKFIEREKH